MFVQEVSTLTDLLGYIAAQNCKCAIAFFFALSTLVLPSGVLAFMFWMMENRVQCGQPIKR